MYTRFIIFILLITPSLTLAQEIGGNKVLVGIPGLNDTDPTFDQYINQLYILSISLAALLAVIKIIIAGTKWMLTDVVTTKGEAKKDIQGSLIGLLVVLGAVLILTVINPEIVKFTFDLEKGQLRTMEDSERALGAKGEKIACTETQVGDHFEYECSDAITECTGGGSTDGTTGKKIDPGYGGGMYIYCQSPTSEKTIECNIKKGQTDNGLCSQKVKKECLDSGGTPTKVPPPPPADTTATVTPDATTATTPDATTATPADTTTGDSASTVPVDKVPEDGITEYYKCFYY